MLNNLIKIINWKIFFISFFVGLIFIYLNDDKKQIFVYPSPSNINKVEYKDKANNCYVYNMEEIKCPSNSKSIKHIPMQ